MIAPLLVSFCGYAALNQGGWIGITLIVVMAAITFSGLIYALANFLSYEKREKLKGIANYEIFEGFVTIVLMFFLIVFVAFSCNVGAWLAGPGIPAGSFTDLFTVVDNYVSSLLFVNGLSLLTNMYSTSIQFSVISNLVYFILNQAFSLGLEKVILHATFQLSASPAIDVLFSEYAALFTGVYGGFLGLSFAALFILALALPIIQGISLTVLLPLSVAFRALAFTGPQLRKVSNQMLAIAIGLYFVLPLTVAFDIYAANCLQITGLGILPVTCGTPLLSYPFPLKDYSVSALQPSLFTDSCPVPPPGSCSVAGSSVIPSFLGSLTTLPITFFSSAGNGGINQFFTAMFAAPLVAASYGQNVAAYIFLSIVMLAIDFAVTVGFMAGLAKGLDTASSLFSVGGFW